MPFLPAMTGNGKHTTYKNGEIGGGLLLFYLVLPTLAVNLLIYPLDPSGILWESNMITMAGKSPMNSECSH